MKYARLTIVLLSMMVLSFGGNLFADMLFPYSATVLDKAGNEMSLEELGGRKLVLAVYTSSMPDCLKRVKEFVSLSEGFEGSGALFAGIDITPLSFDAFVRNVPEFTGDVLFRKDRRGKLARELGVHIIPTTFFISPEGQIMERIESIHAWDSKEFGMRVKKFLKEQE
jgi:peroxiredoxin